MIRRRYRCPNCHRQFDYDHHPSIVADPLPDWCPYEDCGYSVEDATAGIVAPHIGGASIVASVDNTIRGMEDGAEVRAQMAIEHGMDPGEAAQLRLTNQRDNLRAGDTSDMPVVNDVTRAMAAMPAGSVGFQSGGLGYSSTVSQGPFPNAGLRAMMEVRNAHERVAARVTGGAGSGFVADRPALETLQPGYKRRG